MCIQKLQQQVQTTQQYAPPDNDVTLIDYAQDVVLSGVTLYEASIAGGSVTGGANAANANTRVAAWLSSFESLRRDTMPSEPSDDLGSRTLSVFTGDEAHTVPIDPTSAYPDARSLQHDQDFGNDSDVELSTEIIESALRDGASAFAKEEWLEAELLYEEALQHLQSLAVQSDHDVTLSSSNSSWLSARIIQRSQMKRNMLLRSSCSNPQPCSRKYRPVLSATQAICYRCCTFERESLSRLKHPVSGP